MLYREIIAVCSEIHTKHINTLCRQKVEFVNVIPAGLYISIFSPYRAVNTPVSVINTSLLMLYREIIAVCSEIHTKHVNTLCRQKVEFVNVKPAGLYISIFSPYRAVNTPRLSYKNQSVKAV
jgi:hypothetical protein